MRVLAIFAFLAFFGISNAVHKEYVDHDSVICTASDLTFSLCKDASKSDLFAETQLNVDLYTGNHFQLVSNFNADSDTISISYKDYAIIATVAYGHDQRPLLYNIEQPFLAVPKGAAPNHNFTFGVYCSIPASYDVNITTNETDTESGDTPGEIVTPKDHVKTQLEGLRNDGSSILGDQLSYSMSLKDQIYTAVIPENCKYYDPSNENYVMPFVLDKCPEKLPVDPNGPFYSKIERKSAQEYQLNFKSFAFENTANSFLGIDCDILLCIDQNIDDCNQACWGGDITTHAPISTPGSPASTAKPTTAVHTTPAPTTHAPSTHAPTTHAPSTHAPTTHAPSTHAPTTVPSTPKPTTPVHTTPAPTTHAPTTHAPTTHAPTTHAPSTHAPTTPAPTTHAPTTVPSTAKPTTAVPSTAAPTSAPTKVPPPPPKRLRIRFIKGNPGMVLQAKDKPESTTVNDKVRFKVNIPGLSPATPSQQPLCNDPQLLNVLFGVIGGLAVLATVLVLTLVYLLCAGGRRRKVQQENLPVFFGSGVQGRPY